MVIVTRKDAPDGDVRKLVFDLGVAGFEVHRTLSRGTTVLCIIGPVQDVDLHEIESRPCVQEIIRIKAPFKLASRTFKAEDTVLELKGVRVGGEKVVIMAGPCAVETEEQVMKTAECVAEAGGKILRGGAFKPRTSPYSFQGLGEEGLKLLRKAGDTFRLLVISEVMDSSQINLMKNYVDILQVGARNMQNFALLRDIGKTSIPVLVKRGLASSVEDWLMAAEYVMAGGNHNVMVCERGIRTFETYTRNTLDLSAVPVVKQLSHLPVIVDPSHAIGVRDKVMPMARAAVAAGADGLLIEVHNDPDKALCDGAQSLTPSQLKELVPQLRAIATAVGRSV